MKSTVSHLKNENYELTENIHRQNMAFISWQSSVDEELEYLQKEVLSSRQNKKYQAWKQERRKRNTLELEAKVEKIEKSDIGLSMGDVSCGLLQNSGKIDLDKSNISHCSVDEKGSSVSLDHRVNTDVYDSGFQKIYEYTLYMYIRFKWQYTIYIKNAKN